MISWIIFFLRNLCDFDFDIVSISTNIIYLNKSKLILTNISIISKILFSQINQID